MCEAHKGPSAEGALRSKFGKRPQPHFRDPYLKDTFARRGFKQKYNYVIKCFVSNRSLLESTVL